MRAKELIRGNLGDNLTPIFFVAGGTLGNIIVVSSTLKSHEAIIFVSIGDIVVRDVQGGPFHYF